MAQTEGLEFLAEGECKTCNIRLWGNAVLWFKNKGKQLSNVAADRISGLAVTCPRCRKLISLTVSDRSKIAEYFTTQFFESSFPGKRVKLHAGACKEDGTTSRVYVSAAILNLNESLHDKAKNAWVHHPIPDAFFTGLLVECGKHSIVLRVSA